tara:strand:- start:553 stop:2172 length:1620 start_codon:yes stop_codon:yes gene_type:complete
MSNTIRIKKRAASGSAGAPSSLSPSELAFNEADLKLYYGFGDNGSTPPSASSIITVGGAGAFFNKTDTRNANTILSGPTTGSAAAPTFRSLVAADIPSIAHTKISDFDTGVRTNRLNELTAPNGAVSLNSQKITGLADPTADADAANKGYVDGVAQGLDVKDSVVATTTANGTLSSAFANGQTIDGITLSTNDRILIKNQNTATENGIYKVNSSGAPTRVDDLDTGADAAGAFVFVEQGTVNAENGFVCTNNKGSAVVGTNNLTFAQFSGAGQIIAGDGLDKSGNTLSLDLKSNGGVVIESTELAVDLGASSITGTLAVSDGGTGSTSASGARTNLGLVIGTDVEPHTDKLTELSTMAQTTANSLADLTAAEVQILDGATLSTAELNYVDGVTSAIQTQLDNKQPLDSELTELATMSSGTASALADLTGTEVAILDGATLTTAELNLLDGVTSTTAELNILDGVTSTATEINVLDGITSTTAELNIVDGNTSATSTTLATADRMVINDNGTMKQVALSDLVTFLEDGSTSNFDVNGGTY